MSTHLSRNGTAYLTGASVPFATEIAENITTLVMWGVGTVPDKISASIEGLITAAITGLVIVIVRRMRKEGEQDELPQPPKPQPQLLV